MKSIGEVAKEFGIDENMLRNWEKKGFLGDVAQIDGKRTYDEDQIERIKFIHQQVQEQRERGWKRTNYKKIEDELTDKFGGEIIVREDQSPQAVAERVFKDLYVRDRENKALLQQILEQIKQPSVPKIEVEGISKDEFSKLVGAYGELVEDFKQKENDLKQIREEYKQNQRALETALNQNNEIEKEMIRLKQKLEASRKENQDLKAELEQEKNKKWWKRF